MVTVAQRLDIEKNFYEGLFALEGDYKGTLAFGRREVFGGLPAAHAGDLTLPQFRGVVVKIDEEIVTRREVIDEARLRHTCGCRERIEGKAVNATGLGDEVVRHLKGVLFLLDLGTGVLGGKVQH